jgi:hypothetical protein
LVWRKGARFAQGGQFGIIIFLELWKQVLDS